MKRRLDFKIKSWGQVTLSQFDRMQEIFEDEGMSAVEKDIALLSILCGVPEEEIWNMEMDEVNLLRLDMRWVNDFEYPKEIKFKHIQIGDYRCKVDVNLQHMTIAQYVDFQTYFKNYTSKRAELLSVFFVPEGKKYGEGYDVVDLIKEIRDKVDIVTFNSVCFFFLKEYQHLTKTTLTYLVSNLRARVILMRKRNPLREPYKKMIQRLREIQGQTVLLG